MGAEMGAERALKIKPKFPFVTTYQKATSFAHVPRAVEPKETSK